MFQKYKEIFFGLAFGIGAVIIDTLMDAIAEGNGYLGELTAHPAMMLYRCVFILLGLAMGWLLWQRNRTEREVRRLLETLQRMQQQYGNQGLLVCSTLQTVLTRNDLALSDEVRQLLQDTYHRAHELMRIAEEKTPAST
jgi:hypothetical protein